MAVQVLNTIYGTFGLLGLEVGLAILIFCNFNLIKTKEGSDLGNGQAAWFLWVAGVAELIASYYFYAAGDAVDAAAFGGFGLFWCALAYMIHWGGDGRVLGPMALGFALFDLVFILITAYVSYTLMGIFVGLLLVFLALIPAAWGKANGTVLGIFQLVTFIIAAVALIGLGLANCGIPALQSIGAALLGTPLLY